MRIASSCLLLRREAPQAAVAAPQSHREPWAVSECVLSSVRLVLQRAAFTLSGGKPHAFLPIGGFRYFLAGGAHGVCVYVFT